MAMLVGAGFSKWAVGLPVARELFDFHVEPWGQAEERTLQLVKCLKDKWDRTYPAGLSEQFIADMLDEDRKRRDAVLWYLTRRLVDPFIWKDHYLFRPRRKVLMFDEHRKYKVPGLEEAHRFLWSFYGWLSAGGGIITTNYDTVVEYALSTDGFNYDLRGQPLQGPGPYPLYAWRRTVRLAGRIPLAKIHGSVSWDESGAYTDGRRGITGGALIMAPVPDKEPPRSLGLAWRLAEGILRRSTRLIVFGFAFNPYDKAVLGLARSAGQALESVLLIDIAPKMEQARLLWPNADLTASPPPPEGNQEILSWQKKWLCY